MLGLASSAGAKRDGDPLAGAVIEEGDRHGEHPEMIYWKRPFRMLFSKTERPRTSAQLTPARASSADPNTKADIDELRPSELRIANVRSAMVNEH